MPGADTGTLPSMEVEGRGLRRWFPLAAGGFATLLAITTVAIFMATARLLNQQGCHYAEGAIAAISGDWDAKTLADLGAPELRSAMQEQSGVDDTFRQWRRLGRLVRFQGAIVKSHMSLTVTGAPLMVATYSSAAQFQGGIALLTLGLIERDGRWQILSFSVTPYRLKEDARRRLSL